MITILEINCFCQPFLCKYLNHLHMHIYAPDAQVCRIRAKSNKVLIPIFYIFIQDFRQRRESFCIRIFRFLILSAAAPSPSLSLSVHCTSMLGLVILMHILSTFLPANRMKFTNILRTEYIKLSASIAVGIISCINSRNRITRCWKIHRTSTNVMYPVFHPINKIFNHKIFTLTN